MQSIQQSGDNINLTTNRCKYNIWMSSFTYKINYRNKIKMLWKDTTKIVQYKIIITKTEVTITAKYQPLF